MKTKREIGQEGEKIAASYLASLGYAVRRRNVRVGKDEIDILAHDPQDNVIVFAEVKTREEERRDFPPEMNLHWKKKICLKRAARHWVARHEYDGGYRMDLVCVADGRVTEHLKELDWEK